jgi:hypothetical protein
VHGSRQEHPEEHRGDVPGFDVGAQRLRPRSGREPRAQRLVGRQPREQFFRVRGDGLEFGGVDGLDERLADGEVAVERADADARPPGDLLERQVWSLSAKAARAVATRFSRLRRACARTGRGTSAGEGFGFGRGAGLWVGGGKVEVPPVVLQSA